MTQNSVTEYLCLREMLAEYTNTTKNDTESPWNASNENGMEGKAIKAKCKLNYTRDKNLIRVRNTKVGHKISLRDIHNSITEDPY
jgi:hypothetical protein